MAVKAGYKQTEVGVIPEDWEAEALPDIVWFQEGPGLRNWQFKSSGLKVINVTNLLESGYLDLSKTDRHISWEEFEKTYKHFLVDDNDVVMASSGNSYCKTAIVRQQDLPLLMNTSVIRFKPKQGMVGQYMLIYLKSKYFKEQIDLMITGGAQPNFGPFHLKRIKVPTPPTLTEQTAIANALSDADALIESLEQLIHKKRNIKQGAMQELLTGKKRLPGFSGEWQVKRLGDHLSFIKNGAHSRAELVMNGEVKYLHYGDIHTSGSVKLSPSIEEMPFLPKDKALPLGRLKDGDLVFVDATEDLEGVGKSVEISEAGSTELVSGLHTIAVRFDKHVLADGFKAYLQFMPSFRWHICALAAGTKVLATNRSHIASAEIALPSVKEQTAIATILSDMDADIAALEEKLNKAKAVKQGMMQELLTGRIRLV